MLRKALIITAALIPFNNVSAGAIDFRVGQDMAEVSFLTTGFFAVSEALAGVFVRQVSLVIPLSMGIHQLLLKNYKIGGSLLSVFLGYYLFYSNIIPLTPRILEVGPQLHHFKNFDYAYSLVYGTLVIIGAFTLPLALFTLDYKNLLKSKKGPLIFLVKFLVVYIVLNKLFAPESISWGEFPYFENTFERTGFYPRGISGTKYHFAGNFKLYLYWDLLAKITVAALITYFSTVRKNILNFFLVFAGVYITLMVTTETFYDRYNLVLVPITLMFFVSSIKTPLTKMQLIALAGFVALMAFLSYQFSMDFVLSNKYVWNRSNEIAATENIAKDQIQGTNAWKLTYRNLEKDYIYNFSYDSQDVNEIYDSKYSLIEEHSIDYPFNLFVNPKVYLYKIKN